MPVGDPHSGRLYVWITTFLLFVFIAIGGIFLLLYILLPPNPNLEWLPVAGVALVCLPWLFWFFTCLYRVISRAVGFRLALGLAEGDGGGNGGARPRSASFNNSNTAEINVTTDNGEDGHFPKGDGKSLAQINSSNNLSLTSHESERPLASSMAS